MQVRLAGLPLSWLGCPPREWHHGLYKARIWVNYPGSRFFQKRCEALLYLYVTCQLVV